MEFDGQDASRGDLLIKRKFEVLREGLRRGKRKALGTEAQ